MSDAADLVRLKTLFDAKVKSFEAKPPEKFRALYPFKDGIADLRAKRASFRTIADLLNQLGVEVSHNTVARFCREALNGTPFRRPTRKRPQERAVTSPEPGGIQSILKQRHEKQALQTQPIIPPERRGPRIADPKNV